VTERTPSKTLPEPETETSFGSVDLPARQVPEASESLERVLAQVDANLVPTAVSSAARVDPANRSPSPIAGSLVAGWIEAWDGKGKVEIRLSHSGDLTEGELARELDRDLVADAVRDHQLVLVECHATDLRVIGVLATRKPKKLTIDAETIELRATRSLLLRVGRAALELRHDGNIEIVGSRISAASRGLFRLVGRMLRLN
jgi:hypothetical protein